MLIAISLNLKVMLILGRLQVQVQRNREERARQALLLGPNKIIDPTINKLRFFQILELEIERFHKKANSTHKIR